MKKIPLNYIVNLFITEKCVEYYGSKSDRPLSSYYTHLNYLRRYISSEMKSRPEVVNATIYGLIKAMGNLYGFGPDIAITFITNYFSDDKYKKYLDFVLMQKQSR